jgi:hypothetical protein
VVFEVVEVVEVVVFDPVVVALVVVEMLVMVIET